MRARRTPADNESRERARVASSTTQRFFFGAVILLSLAVLTQVAAVACAGRAASAEARVAEARANGAEPTEVARMERAAKESSRAAQPWAVAALLLDVAALICWALSLLRRERGNQLILAGLLGISVLFWLVQA